MIHTLSFLLFIASSGSVNENRPDLNVSRISPELLVDAYAVIRSSEITYEIQSPKDYVEHVQHAVTIMDERSDFDYLWVYHDQYSKAKILWANIYDHSGMLIRKVKKNEIQDVAAHDGVSLHSDARLLITRLLGGSYPYTIEYAYEVTNAATMSYVPWTPQDFNVAVESAMFSIQAPQDLIIYARELNGLAGATTSEEEGVVTRAWKLERQVAIPEEEMSPPSEEIFPQLLLSPKTFRVAEYEGSMSDWKSFGSFIQELNAGREALSEPMATKVRAMIANAHDDQTKVDILYRYLKESMRYVSVQLGIGGWQSYDAKYVEANKYGDCKALSHFMKGMLAEAGIESYPVLVSAGEPTLFLDDFVTPGSFNHMMLHIPSMDMWLECTSNDAPTGYVSAWTADRDVLLITPMGGVKSRTPETSLSATSAATNDSIFFSGGSWHINGKRHYSGAVHEYYRHMQSTMSASEKTEYFREHTEVSIEQIDTLEYTAEENADKASCTYAIQLTQYGSVSGSRLFIPFNALYKSDPSCTVVKRRLEVHRELPVNESNKIVIQIPEDYSVESLPAEQIISDDRFGSFHLSLSKTENKIVINRSLKMPPILLKAEDYTALCAFNKKIQTADLGMIVLKKK